MTSKSISLPQITQNSIKINFFGLVTQFFNRYNKTSCRKHSTGLFLHEKNIGCTNIGCTCLSVTSNYTNDLLYSLLPNKI